MNKFSQFSIGFDKRDKEKVYKCWDDIFSTNQWCEGKYTKLFEEEWANINQLEAVAFSSWSGAAMACMQYFGLVGKKILCPTNTFMATPQIISNAGAELVFGDCNRNDLCLSYDAVIKAHKQEDIKAVWLVHIGGHIAFEIDKIADYCRQNNLILLEDCAHAHGASWNGKAPGSWGDAGVYSFYATKTISTGEGGILVSKHNSLCDFAKKFRNYGKFDYDIRGLNYRMSEFTAALGLVQTKRLSEIVEWKNHIAKDKLDLNYPEHLKIPEGMVSGYYKYIVFQEIEKSTGKVYDQLCHKIMNRPENFPNADWVANNHWCVPLYYNA